MQPATRALIVFGILALILLPVIWLWGGGYVQPDPAARDLPTSADSFDSTRGDLQEGGTDRSLAEEPLAGGEDPDPGKPAEGLVELMISVREEASGRPLPEILIVIDQLQGETDAAGQVKFQIAAGRYFLSTQSRDQTLQAVSGRIEIPAVERKELLISLRSATDLSFYGRLVLGERPVPGAKIQVHNFQGAFHAQTQFSAADGSFAIQGDREQGYVKLIEPGYSPVIVPLTTGHETSDRALDIPLTKSASLDVTVTFSDGRPVPKADVLLEHQSRLISFPIGLHRGTFMQSYRGETDLAGHARLEDLPVNVPLQVTIKAEGNRNTSPSQAIFLKTGSNKASFKLPLGEGQTLVGRVVDEEGQGISALRIGAQPSQAAVAPSRMPPWSSNRNHPATYTDADGRFTFEDMPPGYRLVGVQPRPGLDSFPCTASCVLVELLPGRAPEPIVIHTWTQVFISGQVLGPENQPVIDSLLRARHVEDEYQTSVKTQADGSFRLGPLPPGDYDISSSIFDSRLGMASPVRSLAPKEGLLLRYAEIAGSISGQVQSAADGSPLRAWVSMYLRAGDHEIGFHTDLDGRFSATGLQSGTWDVSANDRRGQSVLIPGLEVLPGREMRNLILGLADSGRLTIHHPPADKPVTFELLHQGIIQQQGFFMPPGIESEMLVSVPAGTWTLRILVGGNENYRDDFTIASGQELRLGPR